MITLITPITISIMMMTLSFIHRKCTGGYKLNKTLEKINHLMNMDDIQFLAKIEKVFKNLMLAAKIRN